ncbi:MAG: ROK family protein [Gammaproteobacteria bacterium]|nr:ROK family protein [Gammaproteobacteria bacterium]
MEYKLGIDLGGTKTEVLVLDSSGESVYRQRVPTPAQSYDEILTMIVELVRQAETQLGQRASVGIGIPGALSPGSGLLRNSNTVCMNGRPFRDDLESRLEREIRIENDANCFALSEALGGAGQDFPVVFGVIIGTGTGGGLVVNGKLLNGPHAISGEWGHNPLPWHRSIDGSPACYCGKNTCIETFLSGPGLASNFELRFGEARSSREIIAGATAGDDACSAMMELYHDQLARSLAHLINILDPHAIVLGGGMSNIESIYDAVPGLLAAYVFSDFVATPILKAERGDASGVYGAALLWD